MTTTARQEQVTGVWVGKGAERLGIEGQAIEKEDSAFEALRLNQHPDGSGKLTPRNVAQLDSLFRLPVLGSEVGLHHGRHDGGPPPL